MTKISKRTPITALIKSELIDKLWSAFVFLRRVEENRDFAKGLFTYTEIGMLAKRLEIAKMLVSGYSYIDIQDRLKVTNRTITAVQTRLLRSEAFRRIVERLVSG